MSRPTHYVDPDTPIYEATIRATGIVPTPPPQQPDPIVIMAKGGPTEITGSAVGVDDRTIINAEQMREIAPTTPARPVGAAAVLAITEPTGVLPRPKKTVKSTSNTAARAPRKRGGK